jgi:putative hemolysin
MEDIVEAIVGDIQNEHDTKERLGHKLGQAIYLLSARHAIDALNEKYRWDIPQGDYDILSGFIINTIESIPQRGNSTPSFSLCHCGTRRYAYLYC